MRSVSGTAQAKIASLTGVMLATVEAAAASSATLSAPAGRGVFFYTERGAARIGPNEVPQHHLAQLGDGEGVEVASESGCLILYGHADPIGEPVFAHGPFVMNTREQILKAMDDYQRGLFGDPGALA